MYVCFRNFMEINVKALKFDRFFIAPVQVFIFVFFRKSNKMNSSFIKL